LQRRSVTATAAVILLVLLQSGSTSAQTDTPPASTAQPAELRLAEPHNLPRGSFCPRIIIEAVDANGHLLHEYSASANISGILIPSDQQATLADVAVTAEFSAGVMTITPDAAAADRFSIADSGLQITVADQQWHVQQQVYSAWLRLLPPLLAIGLAIVFREVNTSLILATLGGCIIYFGLTDISGSVNMFCQVLVDQLADPDHASIILFTVLLGSMIGLMNDSGGTQAVVNYLATFADNRKKGQVLTWLMGLVVFFDDYANTMLIGSAVRPLSDRLRISREKLAFLIDTTAAPIAGLAIVSTWVAFEIDQISVGLNSVGITDAVDKTATSIFLSTIPYRIYPIAALVMVAAVAISGRDFGSMLKAEREALNQPPHPQNSEQVIKSGHANYAIWPIIVLVTLVVVCWIADVDSYRLLIIASLAASAVAYTLPLLGRQMSFEKCSESWVNGITSMIPAIVVLVLAWSVSDVCRPGKLDTAGYIVDLVGQSTNYHFLPCIAFIVAGAVALSIGSSFTTMALLMPLFIPLSVNLLTGTPELTFTVDHPVFLATTGAILAGAIFGDHCSPISDTTVLSSAAAGCDHLKHVSTQIPYALVTAACSLLFGYLPIGFGIPWWIAMPMAAAASAGTIVLLGQTPESLTESQSDSNS
jgi:Na+/H+ antiporter NhaC